MINGVWMGLILIGIVVSFLNGNVQGVTDAAINSSKSAVEISIGLVGVMSLWLGIMAVAKEAGLVDAMGRGLRPLLKKLFPEIPENHPAMGSIVANIAANFFGLGNAATPLGIKAMQELQDLNPNKDEASNSMVTFLAINTSSVTLISSSVIAYRTAANSANPAEIIAPTIIATIVSTTVAIVACKLLEKSKSFRRESEKTVEEIV
ncbi:nucleoside recognition protein [Cetobacterium sp. 2A]|uniref:nucleoside recognition domain-containing protein n=1 Tax=unclassified Cetobacterium TaxID=2630983 RepID=UPI00163C2EE9|nr:nucleoside recognition domain-containing protein [Cetobacterium sp. 2A]MBC2855018.1 nucleoside recognition protein [Cetobacterium sp. 2A]